jgi:uncharacterized membrane protein
MDAAAVKIIVIALMSLLIIDAVWLFIRYDYHKILFESIQKQTFNVRILSALSVYIIMALMIYLYVIKDARSFKEAGIKGTILGALIYLFYDLTNYATFQNWTFEMVVVDSAWGAFLCGTVGAITYYMTN